MVLVLALGALLFAVYRPVSLVSLFLLGFAGVAQLLPGVVLGLFSRRVTTSGVFAGLVTGIALAVFLILTGRDPCYGVNAGFIALCCNFAVTGATSVLTRAHVAGFDEIPAILAVPQSGESASLT
jgi:solute:Na+ symporter, SSS family